MELTRPPRAARDGVAAFSNKEKAAYAQTTDKEDAEKKIPDSSSQHSDLKAGESLLKEKTLKLTVVAARKLKKSGLFGKADPYVVITYGSQKTKSGVIKNNLNMLSDYCL